MSGIDAMGLGYLVGLVISLAMWWWIDIQPQIREIRRARRLQRLADWSPDESNPRSQP